MPISATCRALKTIALTEFADVVVSAQIITLSTGIYESYTSMSPTGPCSTCSPRSAVGIHTSGTVVCFLMVTPTATTTRRTTGGITG